MPGKHPGQPLDQFSIEELPDRVESLAFLAGWAPKFGGDGPEVATSAASAMVD